MKISDVTCPYCGTAYYLAQSETERGSPGQFQCEVCRETIAAWDEPELRVYRMMYPVGEGYLHIETSPPPLV